MSTIPAPLVSLIAQIESATAEARALAQSTSEETFTMRPDGKRWSAADCLAHLSATNERYLRKLEKIVAEAPPSASPRYRFSLTGRMFKALMEPPVRKRFRAPKIFRPPAESRARDAVLSEFESTQRRLIDAIRGAAAVDFTAVRMRSPVTPLLRLNLWDAFQAIAAHERRHLWQARRTVEALAGRSDVTVSR